MRWRGVTSTCYYLVDGEYLPPGLTGRAIVRGDATEEAIAAASVVASAVHERCMMALARREPHWDLDTNLGWPSRTHLQRIVAHGPASCHRASCFPFERRAGRRLAFHPDRHAYANIQARLQWASSMHDSAEADGDTPNASDEREVRYRNFAERLGVGGGPALGGRGGARRRRRAR